MNFYDIAIGKKRVIGVMQKDLVCIFFELLRISLDVQNDFTLSRFLTDEEWWWEYRLSVKQSLVGLIYGGIQKIPMEQRPPRKLMLKWAFQTNLIQQMNARVNSVTEKVTEIFEQRGKNPVILKGQANALLYSNPLFRQPGDVDILIEGKRKDVEQILQELNIVEGAEFSMHHARLSPFFFEGITVEVHFVPTSSYSPISNKKMQKFLSEELIFGRKKVKQGFFVPGIPYALVMQLSHLKRHFFGSGVGLRQLVDYHQLLLTSTLEDRNKVEKILKNFGLFHMASAVMWIMQKVFGLNKSQMLCSPDKRRGIILLNVAVSGGNFGYFSKAYKQSLLKRWLYDRLASLKLMRFDLHEAVWHEIHYWKWTLSLVPKRIKYRKIALGKR